MQLHSIYKTAVSKAKGLKAKYWTSEHWRTVEMRKRFCNHAGPIAMGSITTSLSLSLFLILLMFHYNEDANFLLISLHFFFVHILFILDIHFLLGARHEWKPLLNCNHRPLCSRVLRHITIWFLHFLSLYCILSHSLNVIILRRMNSKKYYQKKKNGRQWSFARDAADQMKYLNNTLYIIHYPVHLALCIPSQYLAL